MEVADIGSESVHSVIPPMQTLLNVFNKFGDYWMCFLADVNTNTVDELLMFNQYVLIKVSDMSSFQLKKSILLAKVEENPIYLELTSVV